ncbi:MAG: hypothetical protein QF441_09705 [Bacteriovoracaceae bacterium]|nr:hypothetical protein [Bacteriovoracaceae bacterium]
MKINSYEIDEENQLLEIDKIKEEWDIIKFSNDKKFGDFTPDISFLAKKVLLKVFPPFIEDLMKFELLLNYPDRIKFKDPLYKNLEVSKYIYSIFLKNWGVIISIEESDSETYFDFNPVNEKECVDSVNFSFILEHMNRGFKLHEILEEQKSYLEIDIRASDQQIIHQTMLKVQSMREELGIKTNPNSILDRDPLDLRQKLNTEVKFKNKSKYIPEETDLLLLMRYCEGMSFSEINEELGIYEEDSSYSRRLNKILDFLLENQDKDFKKRFQQVRKSNKAKLTESEKLFYYKSIPF